MYKLIATLVNISLWMLLPFHSAAQMTPHEQLSRVPGYSPPRVRENLMTYTSWEEVVAGFRSNAKTGTDHVLEHATDTKACVDAFSLLRGDPVTTKQLSDGANETFKNFKDVLAASKFYEERPIKHIVENASRFAIDVDFHLADVAARMDEVFCLPLLYARVQTMERVGPSPASWELRKESLDRTLKYLAYPQWEMSDGLYSFDGFFAEIAAAHKIYGASYTREFQSWLRHAKAVLADHTKKKLPQLDKKTRDEHRKTVRGWIKRLNSVQAIPN